MNNSEMFINQLGSFKRSLDQLYDLYPLLILKRLNNTLTRDELFIYELVDSLIPLIALLEETKNYDMDYSYILTKVKTIKGLSDAAFNYFNSKVTNDSK